MRDQLKYKAYQARYRLAKWQKKQEVEMRKILSPEERENYIYSRSGYIHKYRAIANIFELEDIFYARKVREIEQIFNKTVLPKFNLSFKRVKTSGVSSPINLSKYFPEHTY